MVGFISDDKIQVETPTIRTHPRKINCRHTLRVCRGTAWLLECPHFS